MNNQLILVSQVFLHASVTPNKVAIISDDKKITYSQLKKRIIEVANYFLDLGIIRGDKIIFSASSSPAFIYGYFASHLIGAIAVPIDPMLPKFKVDFIIKKISPKKIYLTDSIDILNLAKPKILRKIKIPQKNLIADILFTSGTTGNPKGVVLTHKNILAAAKNINLFIGNSSNDKEVIPLPLSHSFGLGRLRCNFLVGSTIILCNGFLNPLKTLELLKKYKATGFSSVPAGFSLLLKFAKDKLSQYKENLRYIEIGSAPMSIQDKKTLIELLPKTRICMHYGLTEASRSLFIEFHNNSNKLDSIGKPTPNVKVKIVNNFGKELSPGSIGLIMIKADTVMGKYFNDKTSTKSSLKNGWFLTEDLGYIDREGYYYLSGRKSDVINTGGEKVYPEEVEKILNKYKGISESVCVGIKDPKGIMGQVVRAYIVSKTKKMNLIQLIGFLRQYLEEYKIPKEFKLIDTIPRTSSGKIQRRLLE